MAQAAPDLTVYAPFSENSKTAKLSGNSNMQLSGDLPRIDSATALYPLYAAFAEATYGEEDYSPENVVCTNTGNAYNSIMAGECDIAFVATASSLRLGIRIDIMPQRCTPTQALSF